MWSSRFPPVGKETGTGAPTHKTPKARTHTCTGETKAQQRPCRGNLNTISVVGKGGKKIDLIWLEFVYILPWRAEQLQLTLLSLDDTSKQEWRELISAV